MRAAEVKKPVRIVGFHSGHDCAYCILEDGIPIIHEEYERISRIKEGNGDALKLYWERQEDPKDIHFAHVMHQPGGAKSIYPESWNAMKKIVETSGGLYSEPGHHQAHAANAFFTSDFDKSLIITFDAGGWDYTHYVSSKLYGAIMDEKKPVIVTTSAWRGKDNIISPVILEPWTGVNIGHLWHDILNPVFGLSSGSPKGNQAGTLMAMASVGDKSKYRDLFRDNFHPNYISNHFDFLKKEHENTEQAKYDIAAALQDVTEEVIKTFISDHISPEDKNICLAGGVSLNSVAIGKIYEWFPQIENIFVPPAPYDAGLAIGAAQFMYHQLMGYPRIKNGANASPYLGKTYSEKDILEAINDTQVEIQSVDSSVDDLVEKLADGKIVSVFASGSESGRRALGNRSILADPRRPDMKDKINEKVKHRQWFRPFAPSILAEEVKNWFVRDVDSPYMSVVIPFKEDVVDKVPAVVHLDGTGRLQTVTDKTNPWYYSFLKKWHGHSGVPIILNTSFNDREPIVETPRNAIDCFLKTNIDYLYFVDSKLMISKK